MINKQDPSILLDEEIVLKEAIIDKSNLVLYNDDVNTFDHVISSLIEICDHDELQAEQCAIIVHYKGKCTARSGSRNALTPMCTALLDRGLSAIIE